MCAKALQRLRAEWGAEESRLIDIGELHFAADQAKRLQVEMRRRQAEAASSDRPHGHARRVTASARGRRNEIPDYQPGDPPNPIPKSNGINPHRCR